MVLELASAAKELHIRIPTAVGFVSLLYAAFYTVSLLDQLFLEALQ
jgi:hypothetical protein